MWSFHVSLPLIYNGNQDNDFDELCWAEFLLLFLCFPVLKVCIFWKCIQYTIHWDKKQMLKKLHSDKIRVQKMPSFFFRELQLITVLLLICDSYMSWSTRFVSLKLHMEFFISDSVSLLSKFIFLFNKVHELFDFKTS